METIETLILELIDTIKTLAPEVFAILIKKQLTDGVLTMVISIIMFGVGVWFTKIIYKNKEDSVFYLLTGIAICAAIGLFFMGLSVIINPEYYAIKDLISLLTGRP